MLGTNNTGFALCLFFLPWLSRAGRLLLSQVELLLLIYRQAPVFVDTIAPLMDELFSGV
ncbi:MAG: hypothetical protein GX373_01865 [Gammaproteobacteria bacterium]|nr:hypothetical protein [Gammaproteobacteria bacterium]